jgi:acetoin utilization deacetylase AcuC-like enzyme
MKLVFSPKCLDYEFSGHPESPARIRFCYEELRKHKEFKFVKPVPCHETDILLAHTRDLMEKIKHKDHEGFNPETPYFPGIYHYARLSAGAAIKAMQISLKKEIACSLMRPPGHHAGRNFLGGFCYFNNIAIAVRKGDKKTAILDIDCHHGQGTQNIFYADPKVLYVSLHQSPLYPGTGLTSKLNCLNYPLPPNTNQKLYIKTLNHGIEQIKKFKPELLGISLGLDTYYKDPLTNMGLREEDYKSIGKIIASLNLPVFMVLEGGYSDQIGKLLYNFLKAFL